MESARGGEALLVGHDGQVARAVDEFAARSRDGEGEDYGRAGDGPVVVILDADDGILGDALPHAAGRALAFDGDDTDARGHVLGGGGKAQPEWEQNLE